MKKLNKIFNTRKEEHDGTRVWDSLIAGEKPTVKNRKLRIFS